jgi:hypothetical protein
MSRPGFTPGLFHARTKTVITQALATIFSLAFTGIPSASEKRCFRLVACDKIQISEFWCSSVFGLGCKPCSVVRPSGAGAKLYAILEKGDQR